MSMLRYIFFIILILAAQQESYSIDQDEKREIIRVATSSVEKGVVIKELDGPYISGNCAMLGIIYIEGAGQSLLKKEKGKWKIIFEGGGAFGEKGMVKYAGFPLSDAENIIKQQEAYWNKRIK